MMNSFQDLFSIQLAPLHHGLPLERPELQDVDDMLTEAEEMELELVGTDG